MRIGLQAQGLDRPVDHGLPTIDAEPTGGDHLGNVARGDGAVELAGIAGLADGDEALALELGGDRLGLLLEFEVTGLELAAVLLEAGEVVGRGPQGLLLRQQEVAREPVLDVDDVAHLAEAADALQRE